MLPALVIPKSVRKSGPHRWLAGVAALAVGLLATTAQAQEAATSSAPVRPIEEAVNPTEPAPSLPFSGVADATGPIGFEADQVQYGYDDGTVTASGDVVLRRGDQSVRADSVTWNQKTGQIVANGNIRLVDQDGNQLFTDRLELTDELKAGAMENLLIALREGGRVAAEMGRRDQAGNIILTKASYTGCAVEDDQGCPKTPTWRVNAAEVTYDPNRKNLKFRGARIELFGISLMPLPGLMLATDGRAISGLLIPDVRLSASNGIEISEGYYHRLADNKDVQIKAHVFTEAAPMISAQYGQLGDLGAFQITGYATRSARIPVGTPGGGSKTDFRGYLAANGRFQFDPNWSLSSSIRLASDRTFLRRYDISRDDRLRSTVEVERIGDDSYLSIAGWATQTLRVGDSQGQVPVAFPVIDYRRRIQNVAGGKVELQLNSLGITRTSGQETQRAFAGAKWDLTRLTGMGQVVTLTGLVRGDVYHSSDNALTTTVSYRGNPGWEARAIATAAIDVKWPLVGRFMGGTQVLTPRFQIVASPTIKNLAVPNEDARAIDLEDSNLFALNRFPGYDRIEDGVRFTYGVDWQWQAPGWRINSTIGQSYRLTSKPTLFPDGTGLSNRASDVVGRTEVRFRDFVKLTHRFRLDKDSLAIRRNEFDATVGGTRTYAEVGYLRLNRDITTVEDLQDREELRFSARAAITKNWSVFGSGVVNLTDRNEDPLNTSDGWQPLRTRLGVSYEDECTEIALTWQRDFVATGDARRGNTFQIYFALRNLGIR